MTVDILEVAQAFLDAHNKVRAIATELTPIESRYLSLDGLGSAGMEVDGILDQYNEKSKERSEIVAEMKRLRSEAGDAQILAELNKLEGAEAAVEYIRKVPLQEPTREAALQKEVHKGIFGRFLR